MQYAYVVSNTFDATHTSWFPARCTLLHGHRFTVRVTAMFEELDNGVVRGVDQLEERVAGLCAELDDRDLSEMIPGDEHTLNRIAAYLWERLAREFKTLYEVEVCDGKAACGAILKL